MPFILSEGAAHAKVALKTGVWTGMTFSDTNVNEYSLVVGGDYDRNKGLLYLLLKSPDGEQSPYEAAPLMLVYELISPTKPPLKTDFVIPTGRGSTE